MALAAIGIPPSRHRLPPTTYNYHHHPTALVIAAARESPPLSSLPSSTSSSLPLSHHKRLGIIKELRPDMVATFTESPAVFEGHSFIVEGKMVQRNLAVRLASACPPFAFVSCLAACLSAYLSPHLALCLCARLTASSLSVSCMFA
jgi:hypothetical protein